MWSAGLAGVAAVVAWWRVVGAGYFLLVAGTAVLLALPAAVAGYELAIGGVAALIAAGLMARRSTYRSAAPFIAAGGLLLAVASQELGWLMSVTGAGALGAVLSEMLLGHWYLVDPRLPRRPLNRLFGIAIVGICADTAVLSASGAGPGSSPALGWAFWILAVASVGLVVAVYFALKTPSYPGVMAATGLSYLAVLSVVGMSFVGRLLVTLAA